MLLFVVVFGIFYFLYFFLSFFVAYFRRSLHTFIKFPFADLSQLWCLKFVLAVCFMSPKPKEKGSVTQTLSLSAVCITVYSLTTHNGHKTAFVFDLIALIVAMTAIF